MGAQSLVFPSEISYIIAYYNISFNMHGILFWCIKANKIKRNGIQKPKKSNLRCAQFPCISNSIFPNVCLFVNQSPSASDVYFFLSLKSPWMRRRIVCARWRRHICLVSEYNQVHLDPIFWCGMRLLWSH